MNNVCQHMVKPLLIAVFLCITAPTPLLAANILYLNSTRGDGVNNGKERSPIFDTLDNYQDGTIFDVEFVKKHKDGDLASLLNAKPIDFYNQIWFDTTNPNKAILDEQDIVALNAWAANNQPEFILDSSFYRRSWKGKMNDSAAAVTINEALALRDIGGGILIGTDHDDFTGTANQILNNFGFDRLFTGSFDITSNGSFVGDLLLQPETVGSDFFVDHLRGLSTSEVPIGSHVLNNNGGNRTIEIHEKLFSLSPSQVAHIGASFETGDFTSPPDNKRVPEPSSVLILLAFGAVCLTGMKRKKQQKSQRHLQQ